MNNNRFTRRVICRRVLLFALHVLLDDGICRLDEIAARAIVALKNYHLGLRVLFLKLKQILNRSAAPRVDVLVNVAHDKEIPMAPREQIYEFALERVRVLVFVNVEIAPALLRRPQHLWVFSEESYWLGDKVIKVERLLLCKRSFVALPHFRGNPVAEARMRMAFGKFAHRKSFPFCLTYPKEDRARRELLGLDIKSLQGLRNQRLRVIAVIDAEEARQAN